MGHEFNCPARQGKVAGVKFPPISLKCTSPPNERASAGALSTHALYRYAAVIEPEHDGIHSRSDAEQRHSIASPHKPRLDGHRKSGRKRDRTGIARVPKRREIFGKRNSERLEDAASMRGPNLVSDRRIDLVDAPTKLAEQTKKCGRSGLDTRFEQLL